MTEEDNYIEFKILDDRKYSKGHLWYQKLDSDEETGDLFKIGVTDFLQEELGDMIRVVLAQQSNVDEYDEFNDDDESDQIGTGARDAGASGHEVLEEETLATLRTSSGRHVIYAPVACHVVELNGEVEDSPELVNEDPYIDGWLMNIRPDELDEEDLLTPEEYMDYVDQLAQDEL
jgi:glycine cleavage system H protein